MFFGYGLHETRIWVDALYAWLRDSGDYWLSKAEGVWDMAPDVGDG